MLHGERGVIVRIGTRGSALARVQAEAVAAALRAAHPEGTFELREISTEGDRTQHLNLATRDWGRGVFVKEIEAALLRGEIDLAVHSLKDVPPDVPPGLALVAFPERAATQDVLVTRDGRSFEKLPAGAHVGTTSARRVAFLRAVRPDLHFEPIRGNVDTRYRKLQAQEYDAIVLAAAGLARLGMRVPAIPLPFEVLPPAPGQGALAIEARADDTVVMHLAHALDHPATAAAVRAERALMADLESGCRLPLGALATVEAADSPLQHHGASGSAGARTESDGVAGGREGSSHTLLDHPASEPPRAAVLGDRAATSFVSRAAGEAASLLLRAAVAAPDGSRILRAQAWGSVDDPVALGSRVARELRTAGAADIIAQTREALGV